MRPLCRARRRARASTSAKTAAGGLTGRGANMDFPKRHERPYADNIPIRAIDQEYQETARSAASYVKDMGNELGVILDSISLFQFSMANRFSEQRPILIPWTTIAGRSAALALRNYAVSLSNVKSLLGAVPQWRGRFDGKSLKDAETKMYKMWPSLHKMRHSVAHPEFYSNPDKDTSSDKDFLSGSLAITDSKIINIPGTISGESYISTFEGEYLQLDLTDQTALFLIDLSNQCFEALKGICK